jgi:hypothetical protein
MDGERRGEGERERERGREGDSERERERETERERERELESVVSGLTNRHSGSDVSTALFCAELAMWG